MYTYTGQLCPVCYCSVLYISTYIYVCVYTYMYVCIYTRGICAPYAIVICCIDIHIYVYMYTYIYVCIYTRGTCAPYAIVVYTHIYIYIYIYICTTHLYIYVQHSCEECIAPPKICNAGRLLEQSIHIYIHIYVYIYIYMYLYIYGANMHYTSSMLYNHCSKSCSRSLKSAQCTFETPGVVSYMSCVHGSLSNAKTPPLGG